MGAAQHNPAAMPGTNKKKKNKVFCRTILKYVYIYVHIGAMR